MTSADFTELDEIQAVQNPAFGAYLIWNLALGYQADRGFELPFPLSFLVLPMLLHRPTFEAVLSTQRSSGLTLFAAKFDKNRETLVALHDRTLQLRGLSLQSLGIAARSRLIRIDYGQATVRAHSIDMLDVKRPRIPERIKGYPKAADKVGYWFSRLGLAQIASTLRIDF